jgi:hypothetical protein
LSTPVTSCTPRGVAICQLVMSFLMSFAVPLASSTDSVVWPRPEAFAMWVTLLDFVGELVLVLGEVLNPVLRPLVQPGLGAARVTAVVAVADDVQRRPVDPDAVLAGLEAGLPGLEDEIGLARRDLLLACTGGRSCAPRAAGPGSGSRPGRASR